MRSDNALITKVKGRFGKYLERERLEELMSQPTAQEALHKVRDILGGDLGDYEDIPSCEKEMEAWLIRRNHELLYYVDGGAKRYYRIFLLRGELMELRRFLRILQRGNRDERIPFVLNSLYIESLHMLDGETMDWRQYLMTLQDKPYFRILEPVIHDTRSAEDIDFDLLDINLKRWYYHNLLKATKRLWPQSQKELQDLVGLQIDMDNLEWIAHIKWFEPEKDAFLPLQLISGGRRLKGMSAVDIIQGRKEKLLAWLEDSHYDMLLEENGQISEFLPIRLEQIVFEQVGRIFRTTTDGLVAAITWSVMMMARIDEIRRILEAKQLHLDMDRLRRYLVEQ